MSDCRPVVNLRHILPINSFIDGNQNYFSFSTSFYLNLGFPIQYNTIQYNTMFFILRGKIHD